MNDLEAIGAITQIVLRSYDEERKLRDIGEVLRKFYLTECENASTLNMSCEYATLQLKRLHVWQCTINKKALRDIRPGELKK